MSFCGTRYDYSWLGLALAVRACTDIVITIVENREEEPPKKVTRKKSKDLPKFGPQMLLFPVETQSRNKCSEFVEVISHCLVKNNRSGWKFPKADYYGYELFDFVRSWDDEEWEPQLAKLTRIANGEIPDTEECLNLISFLDGIEGRALGKWRYESRGGGCF